MRIRPLLLCLCVVALLPHCKKKDPQGEGQEPPIVEPPPDPATACTPPTEHYLPLEATFEAIPPEDTAVPGETISAGDKHYLVLPPLEREVRGELFVWLPGSGARTRDFKNIMSIAAFAGYRGLSLAYQNQISVNKECGLRCAGQPPETCNPDCDDTINFDCEEGVRQEIVYGDSIFDSACTAVSRADSIENRLLRVVQALAARPEHADFSAFLDSAGTGVNWSRIAIAGWSQGGGHAGLIARDHEVARALYVSKGAGAVDLDGDDQPDPAPWAGEGRRTPPEREFGSTHRCENAMQYSPEVFERFCMKKFGDYVNIDGLENYPDDYAQYRCTHLITTEAVPACGARSFHKSMATDDCLAKDSNGVPILAPAYYYFLTVDVPASDWDEQPCAQDPRFPKCSRTR